jgi:leucyl-tRNA synthetase
VAEFESGSRAPVSEANPGERPQFDESLAAEQVVTLPVQIDGKTRFRIEVSASAGKEEIAQAMASHPEYARHTEGATVSRMVIVPGRIVNIVTQP